MSFFVNKFHIRRCVLRMSDTISSRNSQLGIHVVLVMPSSDISIESVHTYKFRHAQVRLNLLRN